MSEWPRTDGLRIEVDEGILVCTIDRPDRAGSLRSDDMRTLRDVFREVSERQSVRAVLLRSEGRNFCGGADLVAGNRPQGKPPIGHMLAGLRQGGHGLIESIWHCPLPVVVAVQGRAAGIGMNLALACDVVVAARSATFASPFVLRGFSPDSSSTWLLPRVLGLPRAKALLMRGQVLDAETACDWGMVTDVVEDDQLRAAARIVAEELATGPTFVLGLTKGLMHRHLNADLRPAMEDEAAAVELSIRGDDFKEGLQAMRDKRPPRFTGR